MIPTETWEREVEAAIRAFAERAASWDQHPGDLDPTAPVEPGPGDDPLDPGGET